MAGRPLSGQCGPDRPHVPKLVVEAPRCNPLHMRRKLSVDCHSKTRVVGRLILCAVEQSLCHSDNSQLLTWTNPNKLGFIRIQPQSVRCHPCVEFLMQAVTLPASAQCKVIKWPIRICILFPCSSAINSLWPGALPTANAGQYASSNCKPLLFWFPCKWRYINVQTFSIYTF